MKTFGYVRVSTREQNEVRQLIAMEEFGVPSENIYLDKQSGKDFNRPKYRKLLSMLQIVTATGQQGHNSGPARDTIAGRKLSQYPARKGAFLYNGRTSFSEEESIMRRSVYGLQESAHSSFHQWNEQPGDRGDHR